MGAMLIVKLISTKGINFFFVNSSYILRMRVIRQSLHINKIHKNNNSFLIIPTFIIKMLQMLPKMSIFCDGKKKVDLMDVLDFIEV